MTDELSICSDSENLAKGELFAGCTIVKKLGAGANAVVYSAISATDALVAIKVLKNEADSPEAKRLLREAKICARLQHDNIVKVLKFGTERGKLFICMEYVEGLPLSNWLRANGPVDTKAFISIFTSILSGLAYAHAHGVIHRDLKPANIMVSQTGDLIHCKIVDFGLATVVHQTEGPLLQSLTASGAVHGSPLYMSPEQCRGDQLDERSDIYAVGCTMYEMVTGVTPFSGESIYAVLSKQLYDMPQFPEDCKISQAVRQIILKCMQKETGLRYQRVKDILTDLQTLDVQPAAFCARRKPIKLIAVCVAAFCVLTAAVYLTHNSSTPSSSPEFNRPGKETQKRITAQSRSMHQKISPERMREMARMHEADNSCANGTEEQILKEACRLADAQSQAGLADSSAEQAKSTNTDRLVCHRRLLDYYFRENQREKCIKEGEVLELLTEQLTNATVKCRFLSLKRCAFLRLRMGMISECIHLCERAESLVRQLGDEGDESDVEASIALIEDVLADAYSALKQYDKAMRHVNEACRRVRLAQQNEMPELLVYYNAHLGQIACLAGDKKAVNYALHEIDDKPFVDEATANKVAEFANQLIGAHRWKEARELLTKAESIFENSDSTFWRNSHRRCTLYLGKLSLLEGKYVECNQWCMKNAKIVKVLESHHNRLLDPITVDDLPKAKADLADLERAAKLQHVEQNMRTVQSPVKDPG